MRFSLMIPILLLVLSSLQAQETTEAKSPTTASPEWKATEVRNLEMATLSGNPTSAEPLVLRLRALREVRVPSHSHVTQEELTVLHGTVALGYGGKFDPKTIRLLPPNKTVIIPPKDRHFVLFQAGAEVEVKTQGPLVTEWVDPSSIKDGMKDVDSLSDRSKKKADDDNP